MNRDCDLIATLWIQLNPHCTVQGCEIDPAGSVHLWIWYNRNLKHQPLELNIGNPASVVIRGLKKAVNEEGRAKRLEAATGSRVVPSGEMPGNSILPGVGERDK